MIRNSVLFTFIFLLFISSCKDERIDSPQFTSENDKVTFHQKRSSILNSDLEVLPPDTTILAIQSGINQLVGSDIINQDVYNLPNSQLVQLSNQLTANSVLFLKNKYGYTDQELITIYGSLTNPEIGALAIVMTVAEEVRKINGGPGFSLCNNQYKAVRCLVSSLGVPCTIITFLLNNMNGGGSSSLTRTQIAQMIRESIYFGINVGGSINPVRMVMIAHDYGICMLLPTSEPIVQPYEPGQEDDTIESGALFSLPDRAPGFCSTELLTKYFTSGQLGQLTLNQFNNTNSIKLYTNTTNWKVYQDPNFTVEAFDGMYYSDCLVQSYYEFIEVKNGIPIRVYGKFLQ